MIYGQLQFYNDELNSWQRTVEFHKQRLREAVANIGNALQRTVSASAFSKEGGMFTDQLLVQDQQFDHLIHQIVSQRQRLERMAISDDNSIDTSIVVHQDTVRTKMKTSERDFINTKYACSIYLSSLINDYALVVPV